MSPKPLYINKYLKLLLIFAITGAIVVACAAMETKGKESNSGPNTVPEWDQKYPKVFTNSGYQGLIESNTQLEALQNLPESQQELIGTITNPFGIRDDILDYILTNIPESNIKWRAAGIALAQTYNVMYEFSTLPNEQRIIAANKNTLLSKCLLIFSNDFDTYYKFSKGMERLLNNSDKRKENINQIDQKVFGWHVIGSGMNSEDENKYCNNGYFK